MSLQNSISLVGTATVGPKGQVVIPVGVRESMGIEPGDKVVVLYSPDKKSVAFITERQAQSFVDQLGERFAMFKQQLEEGVLD